MPRIPPDHPRVQGTIRRLVRERGFGFIGYRDGNNVAKEIFFHRSGLTNVRFDTLMENDDVEFVVDLQPQGGKGPRAEEVTKV